MKTSLLSTLALGTALLVAAPVMAQTSTPSSTTTQTSPATQPMPPGRGMGYGQMGGRMGPGMMGRLGMGYGRCNGMGMGGGMTMMRYPDGTLAFLKTELKIKESQTKQWDAFAHALKTTATSMGQMWQTQRGKGWQGSLPERLQHHEQMMAFGLESMRTISAALVPLYNALDAQQKQKADSLFMSCGSRGMGGGMGMGAGMGWGMPPDDDE